MLQLTSECYFALTQTITQTEQVYTLVPTRVKSTFKTCNDRLILTKELSRPLELSSLSQVVSKTLFFFFQHMVQNQMTPTYSYPQAPGLEEYHQVVASQAGPAAGLAGLQVPVSAISAISTDTTPQTIYTTSVSPTAAAVEQQTVGPLPGLPQTGH